jgi:hypothetical protein
VEVADRIGFEFTLGGDLVGDLWQLRNAVALKTAMQRRTRQMGNGRLQRVDAIVERQQRVPSEGDDNRFLFNRENCRPRFLRSRALITN